MLRKALICLLLISLAGIAVAQNLTNDVIDVKYEKKSTKMAMALSAIFPGAGQFYANPKSITTYIFPLLEVGLWYGYFHYNKQGDDAESDYEDWANHEQIGVYDSTSDIIVNGAPLYEAGEPMYRYDRRRYEFAKQNLLDFQQSQDINSYNFYENHFKLDETDTQHFYEDIAKYDKYIIGWADWFDIYATDTNGDVNDIVWLTSTNSSNVNIWYGNSITNPDSEYLDSDLYDDTDLYTNDDHYSGMRQDYIKMRQDAEEYYDKCDNIKFGLIINRVLASLDAMRLARNHNRNYLASNSNKIKVAVTPVYVNNELSPALMFSKSF